MREIINDNLSLKESNIHGIGVFSKKSFSKNEKIGLGMLIDITKRNNSLDINNDKNVYLRTSFMGFFNYSDEPNCILKLERGSGISRYYTICCKKDIKIGEELTLKYTWYNPTKPETIDNQYWNPLPNNIKLEIIGNKYGLFALGDINNNIELGVSHIFYTPEQSYIENSLGGFMSHSDNPNCILHKRDDKIYLITNKYIKSNEELTISYEKI